MGVIYPASNWGRATAPHAVSVLVTPPGLEPLTVEQAWLRAGVPIWTPDTARDALMTNFLAAARSKVEQDSGRALLTQTRDVFLDAISGRTISLPAQSTPLQAVTSIKSTDTAGLQHTLDPSNYDVDLAGARISLSTTGVWPTQSLRSFQPYVLRIVAGYASVALLTAAEPMLVHLVGRLVAHYATLGRDLASVEASALVPYGYEDDIAPYRPVVVA
jgi:uncharacterized phiE125 gp8 family phage protein